MSSPEPSGNERVQAVLHKVVIVSVVLVLLVASYFLLASLVPRWWAQRIADQVQGSFRTGITLGLSTGFVCTFIPILLVLAAILVWNRWKHIPTILCAAGAVIAALPNLLTLTVVLGRSDAAHAGDRVLDVLAPAYRGATAWGAIIGVLASAVVIYFILNYRRRGRRLHEAARPADGE
ncbi:hypothetical protein MINS_22200 [Mycolicibacterium insubricum]|jgi:glucan phosphoethanolaminetransferase (alkaline phosphatase superfamily)|uniref:Uncharacterized protein n=1 Tax=Mycolicibacterium insubricum TaxID=444597 RepID=A0A1X0DJQ5_9MYCO|nr:hypothetical protein [Mycolicibacterium insubricum]MCB9439797.1 hypothetical protein [Mycolicibacterium sp.]MCV7080224.1 hypothetical protein [Mycolicibacterium insubricum]ORA72575.1 hypothetical protein BST26_04790 [Mycolicibacterium insubricum]BBZ66791.1 hypothetical protein MINS_22200 [Mycolicibacterium insubricum]